MGLFGLKAFLISLSIQLFLEQGKYGYKYFIIISAEKSKCEK